jgi:hypothetical protein
MRRRVIAVIGGLILVGCSAVLGLDPPAYDTAKPADAGADTAVVDAATAPIPGKFDDPTRWTSYGAPGEGYVAGPFDGRFIYFIRQFDVDGADAGLTGSRILRYDTQGDFTAGDSWQSFDPEVALTTTGPHAAAVLEGKYLIVAAYQDGVFLRYDTTRTPYTDFGFSSSWDTYTSQTGSYNAALPIPNGSIYGNSTAYTPTKHTGESFDAGWETATFDGGTFACALSWGGACTNKNIFLGPAGGGSTCIGRYDLSKPLQDGWDSFDLQALGPDWLYLNGIITTSDHVYLTQFANPDASAPLHVMRKPIDGALDGGWEMQATNVKNALARGNVGGVFDGRFLYFAPYPAPTTTVIFTRYDTTLGFNDPAAWDIAAGAALALPGNRYWGAVFDGQYVYYPSYTPFSGEKPAFARFKAYDSKIPVPPICRP